jgi:hypothetical protein
MGFVQDDLGRYSYVTTPTIGCMHRRHLLTGIAGGIPLLTGCAGLFESGGESTEPTTTAMQTMTEAGQTAAETPTLTSTSTPTPTATSTPTPTPTPMATATQSSTETAAGKGSVVIDPSNLTTYTNEKHSYTVKRPVGWETNTAKSTTVTFTSAGGFMIVQAVDVPGTSKSVSLKPFIKGYFKGFSKKFDDYRILGREKVQLPNNHTGTIVNLRASQSSVEFRGKAVFTFVNGTIYVVFLLVRKRTHGPTVKNGMMKIIKSLTITSSSTPTQSG